MLIAVFSVPNDLAAQFGGGPQPRPPKIFQQPSNTTVDQGQTATLRFAVEADNAYFYCPTITFQWMKDGARLTGATNAILTITNAQASNAGSYQVVASNKLGWVSSNPVTITVVPVSLPTIIRSPVNLVLYEGQTAIFDISAAGSPTMTYLWRKNGIFLPGATQARLILTDVHFSNAGDYDALVTNSRGTVITRAATLTVLIPPAPAPVEAAVVAAPPTRILTQPNHVALRPGESAVLAVAAQGVNLTYQWKKNGAPLAGATTPAYTVADALAADMGFYSVTVGGDGGTAESDVAILTLDSVATSRLVNLSTRGFVAAGGALTAGVVWRGSGTKNLLIRAVGPTLAHFGVDRVLADPRLEIIPAGAANALLGNDDWGTAGQLPALLVASSTVGAFALDPESKDAAVLASLGAAGPRNYTARITAADPAAEGIVLAEMYDIDAPSAPGRLVAVSTLGFAGTGELALVPGFTIAGSAPKRLLLRAIGPGLKQFGVGDVLASPRIALYASGLEAAVVRNENWANDAALATAAATAGAFALAPGSEDSALLVSLPPGSYTVMVSGAGGVTGTALVEIYDLDP
jgi:hypothetical protein